jgi:hypothetical protein
MTDNWERGVTKPHLVLWRRGKTWTAWYFLPSRIQPGARKHGGRIHGRYPVKWDRIKALYAHR